MRRRNENLELLFFTVTEAARGWKEEEEMPLLTARIVKGECERPNDRLGLFFMALAKRRRNKNVVFFYIYTVTEVPIVKRRNEEPEDRLGLFFIAPAKRPRNKDLVLFFYSNGKSSRVERRRKQN